MSKQTCQAPSELSVEPSITRRDFMWRGGATVVTAAAATGLAIWLHDDTGKRGLPHPEPATLKDYFADIDYPESAPRLSIVHDPTDRIDLMVQAAVDGLGGMQRFIRKGDRVLIKPNAGFERDPRVGATTNPEVLRHVIRLCNDAGAGEVLIADNPIEQPEACFARTGLRAVAQAEGARVLLPVDTHFRPLALRSRNPDPTRQEMLGTWPIFFKPLEQADKVIGIAPIKDHNLCGASMIMKNWYGLLGGRRNQFHQAIHSVVSDLGLMMSPTLVLADGIRVLMRNGPTGGSLADVRPGHTLVAAVDQVACDAWCCENLLERDSGKLAYLELARRKITETAVKGNRRFAESDWRVYQRQGKLVEQNL